MNLRTLTLILTIASHWALIVSDYNAFTFSSMFTSSLDNFVTFLPTPNVSLDKGASVCLRAKFEFWNDKVLFTSSLQKMEIKMFPYTDAQRGGNISFGDYFINFPWFESPIAYYSTWNSLCLIIDKVNQDVFMVINAKQMKIDVDSSIIQITNITFGEVFAHRIDFLKNLFLPIENLKFLFCQV
jgi:hypothetical protein